LFVSTTSKSCDYSFTCSSIIMIVNSRISLHSFYELMSKNVAVKVCEHTFILILPLAIGVVFSGVLFLLSSFISQDEALHTIIVIKATTIKKECFTTAILL